MKCILIKESGALQDVKGSFKDKKSSPQILISEREANNEYIFPPWVSKQMGSGAEASKGKNHEAVFQRKKLQDPFRSVSLAHQTEATQQTGWNPALLDGALVFLPCSFIPCCFLFFLQEKKEPRVTSPQLLSYQSCRAECALKWTGFAKQHSPQCSGLLWSLPDAVSEHCSSGNSHKIWAEPPPP